VGAVSRKDDGGAEDGAMLDEVLVPYGGRMKVEPGIAGEMVGGALVSGHERVKGGSERVKALVPGERVGGGSEISGHGRKRKRSEGLVSGIAGVRVGEASVLSGHDGRERVKALVLTESVGVGSETSGHERTRNGEETRAGSSEVSGHEVRSRSDRVQALVLTESVGVGSETSGHKRTREIRARGSAEVSGRKVRSKSDLVLTESVGVGSETSGHKRTREIRAGGSSEVSGREVRSKSDLVLTESVGVGSKISGHGRTRNSEEVGAAVSGDSKVSGHDDRNRGKTLVHDGGEQTRQRESGASSHMVVKDKRTSDTQEGVASDDDEVVKVHTTRVFELGFSGTELGGGDCGANDTPGDGTTSVLDNSGLQEGGVGSGVTNLEESDQSGLESSYVEVVGSDSSQGDVGVVSTLSQGSGQADLSPTKEPGMDGVMPERKGLQQTEQVEVVEQTNLRREKSRRSERDETEDPLLKQASHRGFKLSSPPRQGKRDQLTLRPMKPSLNKDVKITRSERTIALKRGRSDRPAEESDDTSEVRQTEPNSKRTKSSHGHTARPRQAMASPTSEDSDISGERSRRSRPTRQKTGLPEGSATQDKGVEEVLRLRRAKPSQRTGRTEDLGISDERSESSRLTEEPGIHDKKRTSRSRRTKPNQTTEDPSVSGVTEHIQTARPRRTRPKQMSEEPGVPERTESSGSLKQVRLKSDHGRSESEELAQTESEDFSVSMNSRLDRFMSTYLMFSLQWAEPMQLICEP
jgi:hypothetical protein